MSFPESFLSQLAKEKQLADRETQVFLALFGKGKTRLEIAEELHVQESAVSTCLSGVYKKFGISDKGPVKESRLKDELKRREELWQRQQSTHASTSLSPPSKLDDVLFQQIREHCKQKILNQHSRMRLLSGEEIGVDQLYVDVWLLNRSPRTFQVSPNKLLETFDLRNDRLGLGDRIQRNPGFEVANANPKLVILGKPGSGKTTFLKHLAVDWCKGEFQPDLIAVLIELRRIRDGQWHLLDAIDKELGLENWEQTEEFLRRIIRLRDQLLHKKKRDSLKREQEQEIKALQQRVEVLRQQVKTLLKLGKLLVLMDGLDEVPTSDLRQIVQNQLQQIAEDYPNNHLILTCRTQIIELIPAGFTSVEVADFSEPQVQRFVQNWFVSSKRSRAETARYWETFDHVVNCNLALKELTMTPVLLNLICLVLQDEGEIPSQREWLYQKGIKLLLSKWNDAKQIDGWEVGSETYRQLLIEQKEALLTEIAASKFKNSGNFVLFQQQEIVAYITKSLRLANFKEGVAVLKAIEAQHGLLIERADELWSFSHLTFQEYFTFQWLTQLPSAQLANKITDRQWQEALKQIVRSQQPADRLLRLIKQAIDQSIANETKLQEFLIWVLQKSESIQANYKPAAIRAFYFAIDFSYTLTLAHTLDQELAGALDHNLALDCKFDHALALADNFNSGCILNNFYVQAHNLNQILDNLNQILDHILDLAHASEFMSELRQLKAVLPSTSKEDWEHFREWWESTGTQWIEQFRQAMIEHRNIGHDWQFIKAQTQQLQRYYDANKFLVKLMQIEGAVSDSVRAEIEDNLLLPWEELQRRQS